MYNKKLLKEYLYNLWSENTNFWKGSGQGIGMGQRGSRDRKPSPVAAYELVYGKKAPMGMRGMYPGKSEHKNWNGISIDAHIEDKWLNDLSNIKNIEMRASCEGHDKQWITFIAFRVLPNKEKDSNYLEKVKSYLNQGISKCTFEIGQQGRPRFIVAAKTWYGQPTWKKFWVTLATRIKTATG